MSSAKGQQGQLNMHGNPEIRNAKRDSLHLHKLQLEIPQKLCGIFNFLSQFCVGCRTFSHSDRRTDGVWLWVRGAWSTEHGAWSMGGDLAANAINLFAINLRPAAMQAIATTELETATNDN